MPGRAFPVAKKITVCQKDFTQKKDSYDKENQQLQTKMSTENPGQTVVECGKAAGYI